MTAGKAFNQFNFQLQMDSKVLAALDGIYQRSLDGDISQQDRQLVDIAMDKIIARCDDFLVNGVQITNEQRAKFRKMRHLAADESRSIQLDCDILTHWTLLRELITECDNRFGRNKSIDKAE